MRRTVISTLVAALAATVPIATAAPAGAGSTRPERIVSLSATATEMLFAIGAGKQVVAVDEQSDFPKQAPTTDLSGYEPNVEAIAGYDPDLVVIDSNAIQPQLEELGIEVVVLPAAKVLDDAYAQIEALGDVTGHAKRAQAVIDDMSADIEEIVATVPSE